MILSMLKTKRKKCIASGSKSPALKTSCTYTYLQVGTDLAQAKSKRIHRIFAEALERINNEKDRKVDHEVLPYGK
jgi:hypothetical protein